jgi:GDP-4-dehydro-6-deoxy-D-mannose reductase
MRILVTGIDGFVGRHLAERWAAEGHVVEGLALTTVEVAGADRVIVGDVRDAEAVALAVREARPEAVVHLAGQTSNAVGFERPAETFAINVLGTIHVLEAARASGVARILLVTSGEVYGECDPAAGPVAESAPLAPVTPYGASKAAQDLIGYQYARSFGVAVVRARSFPHTGPGQDSRFVFPSVARRIALAEAGLGPAEIELGNLDVVRDVIDVRDVVEAYARLLDRGEPGEVYNVCRGVGLTLGQRLEAFAERARTPVRFLSRRERFRAADIAWLVGDPGKTAARTGWRPHIEWEDTVQDLLEEWRVNVSMEAVVAGGSRDASA